MADKKTDLDHLELPRHVHKYPVGTSLIVRTREELNAALADGWCIDPQVNKADPQDAKPAAGGTKPKKP